MTTFDARRCELGEGALWHPERAQLFWFDIIQGALLTREGETERRWELGEMASAAGWIDRDHLLIASETALWRFRHRHWRQGAPAAALRRRARIFARTMAAPIPGAASGSARCRRRKTPPAASGATGKASSASSTPASAFRTPPVSTPAASSRISPTPRSARSGPSRSTPPPAGRRASRACFFEDKAPDGAVTDAEGRLWIARWGGGRVTCHTPDGTLRRRRNASRRRA